MLALWKKSYDKSRQHFKKQRHHFADKGLYNQSYCFSSSHVLMWELDHKEDWAPRNWCFQTVVLERTLESLLDCKEIKPVNPKGYQPWIFIGRTGVEAEAPIPWPLDVKEPTHWKRSWCWERLRAGEEGNRRWDGWTASLTQRTWVWINSRRQGRTEKPGVLQSMHSQGVGRDLATKHQQYKKYIILMAALALDTLNL